MAWRNRIVGNGTEVPDQLLANPRNWRIHPDAQQQALKGALDQVGWVQQVIVNQRSGFVVDGHLRVALAISHGEPAIPVVYVDLDENEEMLVLASIDPLSAMAVPDQDLLLTLLGEVQVDDDALLAALKALAGDPRRHGQTDPDDVPEPPETPHVQRGEVYVLGEHRLMCGDFTDQADVRLLLDGERPNLMITDPPYGVNYDPTWRDAVDQPGPRRRGAVTADDRADWSEAWALSPSNVAYVWHAGVQAATVQRSLESVGYEMRSQIIWVKQALVFGRSHYHWQHEPCWYAVRAGASGDWIGDHKNTTTWNIDNSNSHTGGSKDDMHTDHSTQKPVECMERPLRNHAGDVYDPFVGVGTTIIAAERLNRRCFAMDIEPKYAQVAIERWEQFTGQRAERVSAAVPA